MGSGELSFAEQLLWQAEHAGPETPPFLECASNLSSVMRLQGALNTQALDAGLQEIVCRHEVLRSRFIVRDGRPERSCEGSLPVTPVHIDLRGASNDDRPALVQDVLARHVTERFDLACAPLLRASVIALADDDHILAIVVHHIAFDRWSKRVLALELKQTYDAHARGRTPDLKPLTAGYDDYVKWQRHQLDGAPSGELMQYWTARLAALTDLTLPRDRSPDFVESARSGTCSFTIPLHDADSLRELSRRCRVTVATTMLAAFKLFLHRLSDVNDVAVGVPLSDRRRPEFEHLVGLFMNALVVRTMLTGGMTFLDLLQRVRQALADACRHQDLPYGRLLQVVGAGKPLYRVVFNFMPGIPASDFELSGLHVTPIAVAGERRSYADLSLHIRGGADGYACRLVYKADLFSPFRARQFAAKFQVLVGAVLDDPHKAIGLHELDNVESVHV
jgi:hypothetical protein